MFMLFAAFVAVAPVPVELGPTWAKAAAAFQGVLDNLADVSS
jgi:hypothetical protein